MAQRTKNPEELRCLVIDDERGFKGTRNFWEQHFSDRFNVSFTRSKGPESLKKLLSGKDSGKHVLLIDHEFGGQMSDPLSKEKMLETLEEVRKKDRETFVVVYSKHLADISSIQDWKGRSDMLCVGPRYDENVHQAAERVKSLYDGQHKGFTKHFYQEWDSLKNIQSKRPFRRFEKLCETMLSRIPGFSATNDPFLGPAHVDLIFDNFNSRDFWIHGLGSPVVVECKLRSSSIFRSDLLEAVGTLTVTRCQTILICITTELSERVRQEAGEIVRTLSADGKYLLLFDSKCFDAVASGQSPDTVLKAEYFDYLLQKDRATSDYKSRLSGHKTRPATKQGSPLQGTQPTDTE